MKTMLFILATLTTVLFLGCSDEPTPQPTVTVTLQGTTAASLEARVREFLEAYEQGDWLKAWSMGSPRSREVCNVADFESAVKASELAFKGYAGENAKVKLEVTRVRVEGDLGYVEGRVLVNDIPASACGGAPSWVYLDGQWWRELEGWENGCK
jgi:hypothetical protein